MPIASYSVLRGQPTAGKVVTGSGGTHYQIILQATGGPFTAAVNTESSDGSEVLYAILPHFTPPDPAALLALAPGMHALPSKPGGLALDFVREQINGAPMITRAQMTDLPIDHSQAVSHATPLKNAVDTLLNQTIADHGTIFAFGSAFSDAGKVDGIHNLHMNQGNPTTGKDAGFAKDNATWQDGALFLYLPTPKTWTAIFIAFQTESWTTDTNGNPVTTASPAHHFIEG